MKRILYIHHGGALGGAPLSLLLLLQQLDRSCYEPIVLCLAAGPVVERFRAAGVETHVATDISDFSQTELVWYGNTLLWQLPGKALRFLPSVAAARRYLQHFQPDLVHLNSSTLAAAAQAAFQERLPVVWHIREPLARGYFGLRRRWLRRRIARHATRVVAVSENDAAQLLRSDRIRVIHNFVDFAVFDHSIDSDAARAHMNLTPAQHVVTMLGGCSAPKGTLPFVRALPLVRAKTPNTRFLVAGPKPQVGASKPMPALLKRLSRADAYDRAVMAAAGASIASGALRFLGDCDDVPRLLAASDLLVFPSVVPHFARPVIEAGAMAKPVVASDLGGPRELVRHDENGLLIPPNDPRKLAEAIIAILSEPARAQAMGEAGCRRARELFDARKSAARTFSIYEELIGT
ncbi:MAG TPA: glycosyltransferase family 4 protein [Anaerolineales bacterium]|jgi:glycosyltransferase involved in cell wall biosynthesis|nr:glycosyltransferase family 4 protein [Anaerolineales bacterium]